MTAVQHRPAADTFGVSDELSLVDLVDRLLEKGAALAGDVVLSVAGVDLVRLGLRAVLQGIDDEEAHVAELPAATPSHTPSRGALSQGAPARATPVPESRRAQSRQTPSYDDVPAPVPLSRRPRAGRVAFDPDDVERGLVQLVLTVVELLREVLERQALRRVERGALGDVDVERLGRAFLELEARMENLKDHFGLSDDDVRLRLGVVRDVG